MGINNFFEGLKVVELASVLAGPAVGMFFAELGAEVIKFENKATNGDVTRSWKLDAESPTSSDSAYFHAVNWGKQHRFIDFHEEKDRSAIVDAINNADIVITNFRGNSAEKYGLDYPSLQQNHKALIYCNLTGYGEDNDRPAYDIVLQAETGYLSMNGIDEYHLCRMPVALIDVLAAHQMKEAILIALLHKMKTGEGSYLSVSLYDTAIASLTNQATNYLIAGHIPKPLGCKHPNIAPYGDLMHCADGRKIVLAVGSDQQFSALCTVLGLQEVSQSEAFKHNDGRVTNREALVTLLQEKFTTRTAQEWMTKFLAAGVPAGIVKKMDEVFADDEAEALLLETMDDGKLNRRVKTVAFKASRALD